MTDAAYIQHKQYMEQKRLIAEARRAAYAAKAAKAAANVTHIVRSRYSVSDLIRKAESE